MFIQKQDNGSVAVANKKHDETWVEFTLPDGETDESNLTWIDTPLPVVDAVKVVLKAREEFKKERQKLVDNIEVTYNTLIFQGDETSQDRMSRAINALPDDVTTILWVAKDNTATQLNRLDLKAILFAAGTQQSSIWIP